MSTSPDCGSLWKVQLVIELNKKPNSEFMTCSPKLIRCLARLQNPNGKSCLSTCRWWMCYSCPFSILTTIVEQSSRTASTTMTCVKILSKVLKWNQFFLNIHGLHYFLFLYLYKLFFLTKPLKPLKKTFFKHRHNRSKDCWPHSFDERIKNIRTQNHKDLSYLY